MAADDESKKQKKNKVEISYEPRHMIQRLDLSGYKHLRFSRLALSELVSGLARLPVIRVVSLRNNGINDDHQVEIIKLMEITKVTVLDLSQNEIGKALGQKIGRKLNESSHFTWLDLSQNDFIYECQINNSIINGLRKHRRLIYIGLSTGSRDLNPNTGLYQMIENQQCEKLLRIIQPKRETGIAINMRNTAIPIRAMEYLNSVLREPKLYLTGLDLRFCYLTFEDICLLANGLQFNTTLVKLDMGNNALKRNFLKFLLDELYDNTTLVDLRLANNLLDDEFAMDLGNLLEKN